MIISSHNTFKIYNSHPKTLFCFNLLHVSFIVFNLKILQSGGANCMFLSLSHFSNKFKQGSKRNTKITVGLKNKIYPSHMQILWNFQKYMFSPLWVDTGFTWFPNILLYQCLKDGRLLPKWNIGDIWLFVMDNEYKLKIFLEYIKFSSTIIRFFLS